MRSAEEDGGENGSDIGLRKLAESLLKAPKLR